MTAGKFLLISMAMKTKKKKKTSIVPGFAYKYNPGTSSPNSHVQAETIEEVMIPSFNYLDAVENL